MSKEALSLMDAILLVNLNVQNPVSNSWLRLKHGDRVKVFKTNDGYFIDLPEVQLEVFKEEIAILS